MLRPILLRLVNIVLWAWAAIRFFLDWIGRSTVVEDLQSLLAKLPDYMEFIYRVPWPVPAALATIVTGVLLYPDVRKLFSRQGAPELIGINTAAQIESSTTTAIAPQPETIPPEEEFLGGGLLGGPLGSAPIGALHGSPLPPAPPRTDPESEHEEKKAAKKAIIKLTREYFEPALHAAGKFKCAARDVFLLQIERSSPARNLFCRAIDYGVAIDRDRQKITSYLDLQRIDKVREMTLDEVERGYLDNCREYARNLILAVSVINQAKDLRPDHIANAKENFEEWRALHTALTRQHDETGKEHLDLHTIGKPHWDFLREIPEPDWGKITRAQS